MGPPPRAVAADAGSLPLRFATPPEDFGVSSLLHVLPSVEPSVPSFSLDGFEGAAPLADAFVDDTFESALPMGNKSTRNHASSSITLCFLLSIA